MEQNNTFQLTHMFRLCCVIAGQLEHRGPATGDLRPREGKVETISIVLYIFLGKVCGGIYVRESKHDVLLFRNC